jgi:nucleoside-diphosphate-sugar epimerase
MANILITGITGLMGRHLSEELSNLGHNIYGVTRRIYSKANYESVVIDMSSEWNISELPTNIDVIYHLAQSDKFRDFPTGAIDVFQVNINSTAKLLDYAKGNNVQSFIYASSGGIYGNGNEPFVENTPIAPFGELGYYLGSKACGEILVQSYANIFQVNIVRPFFLYGPTQKRDMLIPRLFDNIANGDLIQLGGKDGIKINPLHVKDAVKVLIALLSGSDSQTYNMAGPDVLSIREICEIFSNYIGKMPNFQQLDKSAKDLIADISLISNILHKPEIKLTEVVPEIDNKTRK